MKLVPLNSIFDIEYGNQFDLYKMDFDDPEINFVSRSSQNLGVVARVSKYQNFDPYPAGLITVTLGGTYLLSSFVQQEPFYTAQNIKVLTPKRKMDFKEKVFYCMAVQSNRFRYTSHGREANVTLDHLLVPKQVPVKWLEFDIEKLININANSLSDKKVRLSVDQWQYFDLKDLFKITGSKTTSIIDLQEVGFGKYPFVTTQATNNGVEGFYDLYTESGNVLTVDSAVLGYCSYQPENFSASDHVEKLIPNFNMNRYIALFLVTIFNQEQYRYNYGRKASQERIRNRGIKLPSKNHQPDWQFMEDYIKSLPYSASL
ncbi:MAG: hypothetical protein UY89_C0006G0003 [Parcubacteria group bacterium GW2011_GWA1_54_9]|nr:MAG: hypothetical protein UY89_C0006G0003 [Parcubacteria group bacterium GW2011_GWA1_54_9]